MRSKILFSIVFSITVGLVGFASFVYADNSSLWINTGLPTETMLQSNITSDVDDRYCQRRTEYRLAYKQKLLNPLVWEFKQLEPVEACWYNTGFGLFGIGPQGAYIRLSPSGPVTLLDNPNYHMFYPLGSTNKLAASYNVGYQKYLYVLENARESFNFVRGGPYDKYTVMTGVAKWTLITPGTTTPLPTMRIAASEDGGWMVAEASSGFIRIDMSTKEVLSFEKQLYPYGYGQDPTYNLSISNDGRYVVIAGGNVVDRTNLLYDLSTCVVDAMKPLQPVTGCGKRNIKADFFPQLATNQAAQRFVFSSDNENITVDVNEQNQWNRYILTAPGKDYHGLDYLALGDSYSSGEGEYDNSYYMQGTDGDGANVPSFQTDISGFPYNEEKCHLSRRSYSYLLASSAQIPITSFKSVTCSGSITDDVINLNEIGRETRYNGRYRQYQVSDNDSEVRRDKNLSIDNFTPGRAAQIEFVAKYKPRVATIGIGGNDIGFADKIKDCIGVGTCAYVNELRQYTGLEIKALYKKLVATYTQLREASPTTRFYVVGYPDVISDDTICAPNVRLNTEERYFAKQVVAYLDTVIKSATETVGFTYLDIKDSLAGNRLCDMSFDGKSVQGLVLGDDQGPTFEIFNNTIEPKIIGNESFHPTNVGHQMIAGTIETKLGTDTILNHNPCAPQQTLLCSATISSIDIPAYFQPNILTVEDVRRIQLDSARRYGTDEIGVYQQGSTLTANKPIDSSGSEFSDLQPGATVSASVYSTEQHLSPMMVDANGRISGTVTLPSGLEFGHHTLVLRTKNNFYQDVVLYEPIIVYASATDLDGDGIPNSQDQCEFVAPSSTDVDNDGIDDGCDGLIYRNLDTTPPTVTATVDEQPNSSGWYNHDVVVHWSATDDTDTTLTLPDDTIANREGEHVYTSPQVCDTSGNCKTGTITLQIDKTPPVVTAQPITQPSASGWYVTPVTITWYVTDNLTNSFDLLPDTIAALEGEHNYISDQVCDVADNCAVGSSSVRLDMTPPTIGDLTWSLNPKKTTEVSTLTVAIADTPSGISRAEYFIGDGDPGIGNGAAMAISGGVASIQHMTDFGTGVYKISARVQDLAGNWSQISSGYLVVYDPTTGVKVRGMKTITLAPSYGTNLPWLTSPASATFGFSVRYNNDGTIARNSDLQFSYKTGENCHKPNQATNCHVFELNATSIAWLTTSGINQSVASFQSVAMLKRDGVAESVIATVEALDATRLSIASADSFRLTIYPTSAPFMTSASYTVGPLPIEHGNIKISF